MSKLKLAAIKTLLPTQLTIGDREVESKREHLAALSPKEQAQFLMAHPMPAVVGPGKKLYITDHHHLGCAALRAKIEEAWFEVEEDLSSLSGEKFWIEMDQQSWVHPLDQHGVRHRYDAIPDSLEKLVDDVYRSLSGFVRDAGGFDKTKTAFAEFVWADFFRRNIPVEDVTADFHDAVKRGIELARGPLAKRIPGFKE